MKSIQTQEKLPLEECRSYKIFKKAVKNEKTLRIYNYALKEFLRYTNFKNYDEVCKSDKIQEILENWIMDLSDKALKGNSIRTRLSPVELLLEMNRVVFYKKILHKLIPNDTGISGGGLPFTNDDIKQMLESTKKLRTKAIIHFIASTGIRPSAIIDPILRKKHLIEMPHDCLAIKVYDNSQEGYWAFLTPEARKSLYQYFTSRRLNGENLNDESPLFVNENDKIDGQGKRIKFSHLTLDNLSTIMSDLVDHAGILRTKTGNRYDKATVYGFRKRFNTILKNNNQVNSNIAEKLMAHKRGLDGVYFVPTIDDCFNEFYKAVADLTVNQEEKLKVENLQQKKKLDELEQERQNNADLRETVMKMGDKIKRMEQNKIPLTEEQKEYYRELIKEALEAERNSS